MVRLIAATVSACAALAWWSAVALAGQIVGYEPFSPEANQIDYWCSGDEWDGGYKLEEDVSGEDVWVAEGTAFADTGGGRVIVKAGSGEFANTVWGSVYDGDVVWADTNGNGVYDVGGQGGDKTISHIIICQPPPAVVVEPTPAPSPSPSAVPSPSPSAPEAGASVSASPEPSEPVVESSNTMAGGVGSGPEETEGGELPDTGPAVGDVGVWWLGAGAVMAGAVLGGWGWRRMVRR